MIFSLLQRGSKQRWNNHSKPIVLIRFHGETKEKQGPTGSRRRQAGSVTSFTEEQSESIRQELDRLCASNAFKDKERLQEFLRYVVTESLAGRGAMIRAKTIAMDAFGMDPEVGSPENAVRVHARRIRQTLADYYRTEGDDVPVRIEIHSGTYAPSFDFGDSPTQQQSKPAPTPDRWNWQQLALGVLVGGIATAAAFFLSSIGSGSGGGDTIRRAAEREAVFTKSPTSLQAVNLAEQARGMILPVFDPDRQRLTSQMFLRAVDLDPDYFGSYAGAAQSLASLAMLLPPGDDRDLTLEQARTMAGQALEIAPSEAWTQSAVGWTALADGDYGAALAASRRAFGIDPEEGNVLDFYAGVALFAGEFEEAARVADPARIRTADNQRLAHRNVYGAANFHLGDYQETLRSFHQAAALGDPVSLASLAYQAAALHALGEEARGVSLIENINQNWPKANIAAVFDRYYRDPAHAADISDRMVALGWQRP